MALYTKLTQIVNNISALDKMHHIEVLRIMWNKSEGKLPYSENQHGVYVNLTGLDSSVVDAVDNYIQYIKCQETELSRVEKEKEMMKQHLEHALQTQATESAVAGDGDCTCNSLSRTGDTTTDVTPAPVAVASV